MNAPLPGDVLAAVLDALPDPVLLIDSNGTVLAANSPAHQAFRAPGTVLVGLGVLDLLPGLGLHRIPGSTIGAGGPGPAETVRITARRTDGTAFPAEVRSSGIGSDLAALLLPVGRARPTGLLLLTARDLTESRRLRRELLRLRAETETLLRTCAEGVLGVDADGRCVLANPAALRLLRYRSEEIADRPVQALLHPGPTTVPPAVLTALATGRRCGGPALLRRSDGLPVPVDLRAVPVQVDGRVVGAMMAFTDRGRELAAAAERAHLTALLREHLGPSTAVLADRLARLAHDPASRLWPEAVDELRHLAGEFARSRELFEQVLAECAPHGAVPVDPAESGRPAADPGGVGSPAVSGPSTVPPTGGRNRDRVRVEITGAGGRNELLSLTDESIAGHGGVLRPRHPADRPGSTYAVDPPLPSVDRSPSGARRRHARPTDLPEPPPGATGAALPGRPSPPALGPAPTASSVPVVRRTA
ncbi:PAS domain-containing protein [Kitasatospora sp. NPDC088391]|uniref:PAS domain-containing protein n=1 Tax=Kitasatospora sp. NPDC088391 TaxID=3364074 RepID=UPI003828EE0D